MKTNNTLRVLELGTNISAAYTARLLADQGADVVKLEPDAGDPTRHLPPFGANAGTGSAPHSGLFAAVNVNKRSVCVDIAQPSGQATLASLLAWADVLVHSLKPAAARGLGLDADAIRQSHPTLVVLASTTFGSVGPYSEFADAELTLAHGGGWANLCPMTHDDPDLPPLKMHGHHCSLMAGMAAAMTTLAVARSARASGVGEHIDFSTQAYVGSVLEFGIHIYTYMDMLIKRTHPRSVAPWRIFDTKDGAIFLMIMEQDQWERLVEFMGNPDWTQLEMLQDAPGRAENRDLVHSLVGEFIAEWTTLELYHAAQQHRICFAPVMTFAQLDADDHLAARNFFTHVDDPVHGRFKLPASAVIANGERAPYRRPAPALGQHNDDIEALVSAAPATNAPAPSGPAISADRPLAGIRVLDMTWVWAGPYGSMNLAHLGADVIRLESSVRPDLYRRGDSAPEGVPPTLNTNGMFNQWNQGKRSVGVDLRTDAGIDIVKALVRESDVLVQNFATGVLARLGLGFDVLQELNPRLILASVSGYGQYGPYKNYMAYGPATGPLSGLSSASGHINGGPEETGLAIPDPTAGVTMAYGVMGALMRRDQTGRGEHLDVSLWEATAALNLDGWMAFALNGEQAQRMGNRAPDMAPHGSFRAAGDDEWVSIACTDETQWHALCAVIPGLKDDARFATLAQRKHNEDALDGVITNWTQHLDPWFVTATLQQHGIAAFPSMNVRDVIHDGHHAARGFIERLPHPEVGVRAHTGIPWRLSNRPNGIQRAAPALGQHSAEVLAEVLDYSEEEIAGLNAADVLQ